MRLLLFSSDCHAGLEVASYPTYFDPKYADQLDEYLVSRRRLTSKEQVATGNTSLSDEQQRDIGRRGEFAKQLDKRIGALEEDGFVGEVLFPDGGNAGADNMIPFGEHFGGIGDYDPALHAAALRAYNRWLGETAMPGRQIGLALVPLLDPEYATDQVRSARSLGLRGVMPQWDGVDSLQIPLYDERFEPMWNACVEDALPVTFHVGCGKPERMYDRKSPQGKLIDAVETKFWCRRPLWHLIFGGVLERHPELRVGFVEMFADWIPRTLADMDWIWTQRSDSTTRAICPRPPSEYWARQCFTGASPPSLNEARLSSEFPTGTLTIGTDFPHIGSPWGQCREYLQATIGVAGLAESEVRSILGENIVKIFNLDLPALREIAERVGPTVSEILDVSGDANPIDSIVPYMQRRVTRPSSML